MIKIASLVLLAFLVGCASVREPSGTLPPPVVAAPDDEKAFEDLGYAHARERLLQMDAMRRAVSGRLAELFGPAKADQDRRCYALGLPQILPQMERKIATKYPEIFALIQAYARGVNRYRDELAKTTTRGLLDVYRGLTQDPAYVPAKWEPVDSIASNLALSFGLTNALEETLSFGAIYRKLFAEKGKPGEFVDFLDARPIEPFKPYARETGAASLAPPTPAVVSRDFLPPTYSCRDCQSWNAGSNMWAVSGKLLNPRSKTAAILASDPHLPMKAPSFYFETSIKGATFHVTGESIPGIPGIAIGHNDKIAWGVTNSMSHVDQVYIETLRPDGRSVKFKNDWVGIAKETFFIEVREPGGVIRKESIVVRSVPHHGNLFSEHFKEIGELPPDVALSYRWAGFDEGGSLDIVATLLLNRASNFEEFKAAVAVNGTSAGNYLYADTSGNIGYSQHGRYPIRAGISRAVPPYIPLPGDGAFEWTGFRDKFPQSYNPESGYLVVVNDDPWGRNLERRFGDFKDYFTFKSTDGCRGKRIRDGIEAKAGRLTIEDMKKLQFDHVDLLARRLVNETLKPLSKKGALAGSAAGKMLVRWDGTMAKDRKEPLVFAAWLYVMMAKHFEAAIPLGVFPMLGETPAGVQTLYQSMKTKPAEWILSTLADAEKKLKDSGRWGKTWGSEHRLAASDVSGAVTPGLPRDGSWLTVDVGGYAGIVKPDGSLPPAFLNTYGPNFRILNQLQKSGEIKTLSVVPGAVAGDEKRFAEGTYRELRTPASLISSRR